jgi:hypothetical protein
MLPVGINSNKKKERTKKEKDEIPLKKYAVQNIRHVRKQRLEMNKDFELRINKLKKQYWDNVKKEYDEIRILEDGVFSSVMEKEMFFKLYWVILYQR